MTQEQLAWGAKIGRRTVQRMEAGEPVSLDCVNQVAAQLGVTAAELMRDADDSPTDAAEGRINRPDDRFTQSIMLKPEHSGRRLVKTVLFMDELDFGIDFEPTVDLPQKPADCHYRLWLRG